MTKIQQKINYTNEDELISKVLYCLECLHQLTASLSELEATHDKLSSLIASNNILSANLRWYFF